MIKFNFKFFLKFFFAYLYKIYYLNLGKHECVSIISSYIAIDVIDKLLHPKGLESDEVFPKKLVHFIHKLTRTHEIHPIRIIFSVMDEEVLLKHRKKILYVIDRLFERQLRSKEPNEVY